jgi:hypothetical protein
LAFPLMDMTIGGWPEFRYSHADLRTNSDGFSLGVGSATSSGLEERPTIAGPCVSLVERTGCFTDPIAAWTQGHETLTSPS